MIPSNISRKDQLRRDLRARRAAIPEDVRQDASHALVRHAQGVRDWLRARADKVQTVASYVPIGCEIDPSPLCHQLVEACGAEHALPCVVPGTRILTFRNWQEGDPLEQGPYATRQPRETASMISPDLMLIPLLGFDGDGGRLGQGGGFYDATLRQLRKEASLGGLPLGIGVAFDEQEIAACPREDFDQTLDAVMTPTRFLRFTDS
ncbi:MAG: 5-formyltetrahydrofolate cyclo-ligase [Pseudomonadota bacterium]